MEQVKRITIVVLVLGAIVTSVMTVAPLMNEAWYIRELNSVDISDRVRAAERLRHIKTPRVAAALVDVVRRDSKYALDCRVFPAEYITAMINMGDLALPGIRSLLEDKDPVVCYGGLRVTMHLQHLSERLCPIVIKLSGHDLEAIRVTAAETMARIKCNPALAVPVLVDSVRKDSSTKVRVAAAGALGQYGADAEWAVGELTKLAQSEVDPALRKELMDAISEITKQENEN